MAKTYLTVVSHPEKRFHFRFAMKFWGDKDIEYEKRFLDQLIFELQKYRRELIDRYIQKQREKLYEGIEND